MARKKTPPKPPACESPTRTVPLSALTPDPDNPRTHDARNLQIITESLRRFGQVEALVVQGDTLRVIGGNGRLEAMRSLGWTECEVREVAVDDHEAKALGAVLNRSAETAGWDAERLAGVLDELRSIDFDLDLFGFSYDEIDALIAGVDEGSGVGNLGREETPNGAESDTDQGQAEDPGARIDKAAELQAKWKTEVGQLWLIRSGNCDGEHRLLCGDSSNANAIERLMDGKKASLFATDPPYGVDYSATKDGIPRPGFSHHQEEHGDMAGDDLQDEKLQAFLESVFRACLSHLDHAAWYLWHAHLTQGFFAAAAAAANVVLHRQIIWVKPGFVLTRSGMYHWQHEPCFYGWVRGQQPKWLGSKSQTSVWQFPREKGAGHPTQKPVALFATPITNHLDFGQIGLEPFSGSGTQLVAAEQLGRLCYACEIEPKYVAVALERLAGMGVEPRLAS